MKLRLKALRNDKKLTQRQVGSIIFVNQSMYSRYENGSLELPLYAAERLANFYGVSVNYLIGADENPRPYPKPKARRWE